LASSPVPECHRLTRAKCLITPSLWRIRERRWEVRKYIWNDSIQ